jgi:SAM-dependent methyltransferase
MRETSATTPENEEQQRLWNGPAGDAWVASQALLDRMFEPFAAILVDAAARAGGRRVLDVGCGTGATTLAIAPHLGPDGECTGVDISAPMIELARERASRAGQTRARFVVADAQTHAFEAASVDTIVSRFGVMFFADPVAAFANLRRAAAPGAALRAIVFRSGAENPFMTTAERAAAPLLPELPPRRGDGPGQFALADAAFVQRIVLLGSGWSDASLEALDVVCAFPESELVPYLSRLGPVGLALRAADAPTRTRVLDAVRAAFEPFVDGPMVRFTAACWMVSARAAAAG